MTRQTTGHASLLTRLIELLLFLFLWFLFVGSLTPHEFAFGGACALIAVVGTEVARTKGLTRFRPRLAWLAAAWRLPWYVIEGCALILIVLVEQIFKKGKSLLRFIPYQAGGADAASSARRALAVAFTTAPPNFVVLGIDNEQNVMLVHQVKPSETPAMTRELGARA